MSSLSCLLDYGCYSTSARCGETCVIQHLRFSILPNILQNWQSGLASLYFPFFHLDKLWGSTLC